MSTAQIISIYAKTEEEKLLSLMENHFYPGGKRKRGTVIMDALKRYALSTRVPELVAAVSALKPQKTKTKITD